MEVIRDETFNLPILTNELFETLQIGEVEQLRNPRDMVYNGFIVRVFDNRYLNRFDKSKCDISNGIIDPRYVPHTIATTTKAKLVNNYLNMKGLLPVIITPPESNVSQILDLEADSIIPLLAFFTIYPQFGPIYEEYIGNPDPTIELVDEPPSYPCSPSDSKATLEDVKATVHLLILLMAKTFPTTGQMSEHVSRYIANRSKAVAFAINTASVKFLLNAEHIPRMQGIWNRFPKLKNSIFYMLLSLREHPEISTALNLVSEASMTSLSCIQHFIMPKVVTRAHAFREIMQETHDFLLKFEEKKREMGMLWVHYRLLKPNDTTLSTSMFPNLSRASIVYVKKFINSSESFKRVIEPPHAVAPGLVEAAQERLPSRFLSAAPEGMVLSRTEQNIATRFGIDIAAWRTPERMRQMEENPRPEDNNDNLQNVIRRLLLQGPGDAGNRVN